MTRPRRLLLIFLLGFAALAVGLALALWAADEDRPRAQEGPEAEALADRMLNAINHAAWERTGAIRWRLGPSRPLHLWDRALERVFVLYDGEEPPLRVVLTDPSGPRGYASRGDAALQGAELDDALAKAQADWINDAFWLNAPAKVRDPGTRRARTDDGQLLVSYASGGVTPGDAYLWRLGEDGRPVAWKMWVQIVPVGGVEVTWEEWTELPTGAWVARRHQLPFGLEMRLDPLEAALSLGALLGDEPDPFAASVAAGPAAPASQPAATPAPPAHDGGPG